MELRNRICVIVKIITTGQKVLLYDSVNKKGVCKKLKRKWCGPFFITGEGDGYVYKLRHCSAYSGKSMPMLCLVSCQLLMSDWTASLVSYGIMTSLYIMSNICLTVSGSLKDSQTGWSSPDIRYE